MHVGGNAARGAPLHTPPFERQKPGVRCEMRHFLATVSLLAITLLLVSGPAFGIAVGTTDEFAGTWAGMDWGYVYNWNRSSAVAVNDYWMLTAAHVADDPGGEVGSTITINEQVYTLQEISYHESGGSSADLAVLRFDKKLPGHYSLYNGSFPTFPPSKKLNAIMIGYGYTGVDYDTYYTTTGGTDGVKRWGTNKIDAVVTASVSSYLSETIKMGYLSGETDYEAGYGTYDSGGGTFVKVDEEWQLAGINAYISDNGTSGHYNASYAVSVPAYHDWITEQITILMGDANWNGYVDDDDLNLLLSNWHTGTTWGEGDFNGDLNVNDDDLNLLLTNWHAGILPADGADEINPVPEPATMLLLCGAAAAVLLKRRRKA